MPARVDDPSRASISPSDPQPDPAGPDPEEGGVGIDRLRALIGTPEPWRDRVGDRVAGALLSLRAGSARQRLVIVAVAAGLGALAFVALRASGATSVDPVQVLPRVEAAPGAGAGPAPLGGAPPATAAAPASAPPGSVAPTIAVHAAGAVLQPGVHHVPADARVADLIAAAGGLAPDADPDRINLAAPVRDGERVYVPRRGEPGAPEVVAGQGAPSGGDGPGGGRGTAAPTGGGGPAGPSARVDLNTADAAALDALPGVGPATAAAIIGHRTEHGPFSTVDELQDVAGIGPAKLAQLRDLVTV